MARTTYDNRSRCKRIDLDRLAAGPKGKPQDTDFLLCFGGVELVIQYRLENAGRLDGHPFIDIVVAPADPPMTLDVVNDDGVPAVVTFRGTENTRMAQLLLGQKRRIG